MKCRDPGKLYLHLLRRNGLNMVITRVRTVVGARGNGRDGLDELSCLVILVVLLVRVVTVLEPAVVLHEAKVDRHLAHRAGHPSALRRTTPTRSRAPNKPQKLLTRRTLQDRERSVAEQRRTNSQVCRAVLNGGL